MSDPPAVCPTCGTAVPPGRTRCVGCGRVFGEDNRCPHCNAIAAVVPQGMTFICAACSGEREKKPGTVVLQGTRGLGRVLPLPQTARLDGSREVVGATTATRAAAGGLRLFGAVAIGLGVLASAGAFVALPIGWAIVAAAIAGGGGITLGGLALRGATRTTEHADRRERTEMEQKLMQLAENSDGDLTVTEVARELRISMEEADEALTKVADGSRIAVEVDPDGIVHYVFRELRLSLAEAPKVRVDASTSPEPEEVEVAAEAADDETAQRSE